MSTENILYSSPYTRVPVLALLHALRMHCSCLQLIYATCVDVLVGDSATPIYVSHGRPAVLLGDAPTPINVSHGRIPSVHDVGGLDYLLSDAAELLDAADRALWQISLAKLSARRGLHAIFQFRSSSTHWPP